MQVLKPSSEDDNWDIYGQYLYIVGWRRCQATWMEGIIPQSKCHCLSFDNNGATVKSLRRHLKFNFWLWDALALLGLHWSIKPCRETGKSVYWFQWKVIDLPLIAQFCRVDKFNEFYFLVLKFIEQSIFNAFSSSPKFQILGTDQVSKSRMLTTIIILTGTTTIGLAKVTSKTH